MSKSETFSEHPLTVLSERYYQLLLPIQIGSKTTDQYKNAVLRGNKPEGYPDFSMNPADTLTSVSTPAGSVDILFLADRKDFEHAIRALAYRCEPAEIPASMGASFLNGLINWEKIHTHMAEYETAGGTDPDAEFSRWTSEKKNYLDALLVLSSGAYSAVPAEEMGMEPEEWIRASVTIRKFHELTHFYSAKLFPANKEAIRDEVIADMIGIFAAFGCYDTKAAKKFLGTDDTRYREGGRLQNYTDENPENLMCRVNRMIEELYRETSGLHTKDVFEILNFVEKNKIGI